MNLHCGRHGWRHLMLLLALWPLQVPEAKAGEQALPSVFPDVKLVRKVKADYPAQAQAQHIEGRVRVRLRVEVDGRVSEVKILAAEPPGVFDSAAMEAAVRYVFRRSGNSYQADQEIIFRLE